MAHADGTGIGGLARSGARVGATPSGKDKLGQFLSTSQHQEQGTVGMEEDTDLAHLGSQVQGTDGPGMGVDLDM